MGEEYTIREHEIGCGYSVLVLAPYDPSRDDFLQKMRKDRKSVERYRLITRAAGKVCEFGVMKARQIELLRTIDASLSLFEIFIGGEVIRVMTYVGKRAGGGQEECVLLFDFKGHQGKTGKISSSDLIKGKKLAGIAAELMGGE
ncbi:MAG: hypothetical protein ACRC75_08300 [Olsenella sp.]|jgi:hypothetical protein